jgi:hypothetical protein
VTVDVDKGKKAEERPKFLTQLHAHSKCDSGLCLVCGSVRRLTFVNKRTADYLGLPKDPLLRFGIDTGAQWDAHIPLLHPNEREESRKSWLGCLRTGGAADFIQRIRNLKEATAGSSVASNRSRRAMEL